MAIEDTVNSIIADSRSYAGDLFDEATGLVEKAVRVSDNLPRFNTPSLEFKATPLTPLSNTLPGAVDVNFTLPDALTDSPTFQQVALPDLPEMPDAPAVLDATNLFKQVVPAFDAGELNVDAPSVVTTFDLPTSPNLAFPVAPDSQEVATPDAPTVTLPRFDEQYDEIDPGTPEDLKATFESAYNQMNPQLRDYLEDQTERLMATYAPEYSTGLAKVEAKIAEQLDSGVLTTSLEQQIYDRARSRIEAERQSVIEKVSFDMRGRGFPIPPGMLQGAMLIAQNAALRATIAAAADTAIKRSELEIQNGQFLLNLSAQMRNQMLGQMLQYSSTLLQANGQAMQYSKDLVGSAAQSYNLLLDQLRTNLQVYSAKAQVYELQLKSSLADLDVYRLELEAAKMKKDFESVDIQNYEARIQGEAQKIQAYLAQLEAVTTEANFEKIKVSTYGEQVKAYAVRVGAKEAEFRAYKAALDGDEARVRAYATQVDAYRTAVQAQSVISEVDRTRADTTLKFNQNLTEQYRSDLARYGVELDASKAVVAANLDTYKVGLARYQADLAGQIDERKLQLAEDEMTLSAQSQNHGGKVQVAIARAQLNSKSIELTTNATLEAAKVLQATAQSALGAQNTMVQLYAENV